MRILGNFICHEYRCFNTDTLNLSLPERRRGTLLPDAPCAGSVLPSVILLPVSRVRVIVVPGCGDAAQLLCVQQLLRRPVAAVSRVRCGGSLRRLVLCTATRVVPVLEGFFTVCLACCGTGLSHR